MDCTCTLGTRSDGWDTPPFDGLPVYDGLVDPFCPVHGDSQPLSEADSR